jgi:competence protein ComFC
MMRAEQLLSPTRHACIACGGLYTKQNELRLCPECSHLIPWILQVQCERCGRSELCLDCVRRKEPYFVRNRSVVRYSPQMKDWLSQYKYRGNEKIQHLIGSMLLHAYNLHKKAESTEVQMPDTIEFITYVPLSDGRLAERGFNQAKQLAEELGRKTGIPVIALLQRVRHTDKQSFKTREDRLEDLQGVFAVLPSAKAEFLSLFANSLVKIYIVDDVYTTGSTLNECSRAIKAHLRSDVYGISWAR